MSRLWKGSRFNKIVEEQTKKKEDEEKTVARLET